MGVNIGPFLILNMTDYELIEKILTKNKDKISTVFQKRLLKDLEERKPSEFPDIKTWACFVYKNIPLRRCDFCHKPMSVSSFSIGYLDSQITCSRTCRNKSEKVKEKCKLTLMERYGVDNPTKNPAIFEKVKKTMEERYGGFTLKSEELREKIKKSNLEKYGVEHHTQTEEGRQNLKRNVERIMSDPVLRKEMNEKRQNTCLERYGVTHPIKNERIKDKAKNTNLDRYGAEHINQLEDRRKMISDRNRKIIIDRIGIEKFEEFNDRSKMENFYLRNGYKWMMDYFKCSNFAIYQKLRSLGIPTSQSSLEQSIQKLILDPLNLEYRKDRTVLDGKEIDIFLPTQKIGIECHGILFHSYNPYDEKYCLKDKNYHHFKYNASRVKGVKLFQFFEDEIYDKLPIIESIIRNSLGVSKKIYARKTKARIIDTETAKNFLNENHLNGYSNSSIKIGLFHEGLLVSVMTFSPTRFERGNFWEVVRFASLRNHCVIGAGSKLVKSFRKKQNCEGLISYSDNCIGDGSSYLKMGFEKLKDVSPGYFWVQKNTFKRLPRQKFQKHKLKGVLETFDPNKTEDQNMFENGYRKIYNAGYQKFILKF